MSRPDPTRIVEMSSEEEGAEDSQIPSSSLAPSRRRKFEWPADMDLEARMAYGRAMMSGHDRDYDPPCLRVPLKWVVCSFLLVLLVVLLLKCYLSSNQRLL
ncbi:hypothetical protein BGW80DRAFT_346664 [Lactifluus volemus]|nr:hypothetical protein BGW80DRAFT_346664 [Lactifluus volemus]